jgi:hypothetical protein
MTARVWADGYANEAAHENDQAGDLGSVIIEHCVDLWVELEVAVGFLGLMNYLPLLPQTQYLRMGCKMKAAMQKLLNE